VFGKKPTDDEDESLAHEWNRKLPHGPVRASKMRKMEATASRSLSEIDFVVFRINNLERFDCL
jgi:hypothetical protein